MYYTNIKTRAEKHSLSEKQDLFLNRCLYYLNFGPDNYVEITPEKFADIRAWISRSEERERELIPDTGAMKPLTISDPIALRRHRERHKRQCCEIALANTPPNVRVVRVRKSLTGRAHIKAGILAGPKPFTRKVLYIFLHECAHFALHGSGRKKPMFAAKSGAPSSTERNELIPQHADL